MALRIILLILFTSGFQLLVAQHTFESIGLNPSDYAYIIEDISTGETIAEHNSKTTLIPASTTKILTVAAASKLYSYDSTFPTVVELIGEQHDDVFHGDILITSFGDPTLGNKATTEEDFVEIIVDSIDNRGIKKISGDIRVDESLRRAEKAPAGWLKEDLTERYGAVYQPTNYASNCFNVKLPSGETTPIVPDIEISWGLDKGMYRVEKDPYANSINVSGKHAKSKSFSESYPNATPKSTLIAEIKHGLTSRGIEVQNVENTEHPSERETLLIHRSPTFGSIMRRLMVYSDNFLAESILRLLAPEGSRKDALTVQKHIFEISGIDLEDGVIEDGSGLSRNNRISASALSSILTNMATVDNCVEFVSLFPRVGSEGTVINLLKETNLENRLVLKSGSMRGVLCYAGYLLDNEGLPSQSIVVLTNNFHGNRALLKAAIENFLCQNL